jgi:hypothetical protein
MKYGAFWLLLLCAQVSSAQIFTIHEIYKSDSAYQLPLVQSSQRPDIAKKINTAIHIGLGVDSGEQRPCRQCDRRRWNQARRIIPQSEIKKHTAFMASVVEDRK